MIKIAVCDDEQIICDMLTKAVSAHMGQINEPYEIDAFFNAAGLLQSLSHYNILLLDIQMPGLNGLMLAKRLREAESRSALIFVTALKEHVFDAFEVEATDYICKPIDGERLSKALDRALQKVKTDGEKCLFIKTLNWSKSVKLSTIYYCEAMNRKVYLYTQNGVVDYYAKIEELEKQLDYRFVKCHRSYLVNLDYLTQYSDGQITLENGTNIPVSRLRHPVFMEAMMRYMKKKEA